MKFHKGQATDAVLDSTLSTIQRLILICYIKHANEDGEAWPGGDRLARMCGTSSKSIKRHRAALMKAGILQLVTGGEGTVYRVKLCTEAIPTGDTESPGTESHRGQRVPTTGDRESLPPGTDSPPNRHSEDHTIEDHTIKPLPLGKPAEGMSSEEEKKEPKIKPEEVRALWDTLIEIRRKNSYRRLQPLKLTDNRIRQLRARMADYSAESIEAAWTWWMTSQCRDATHLRDAYGIDTFIRPSRHDRYHQQAAKEEAARADKPSDTPAPSGPLSEADQERLRREWEEAREEEERKIWEQKERDEAAIREMLGKPPIRLVEDKPKADDYCSWSEYQESLGS